MEQDQVASHEDAPVKQPVDVAIEMIKIMSSDEFREYWSKLPRNLLNAGEKHNFDEVHRHLVPTDLEDEAETPQQKRSRSRGRPRKHRLSTGSGVQGRPRKHRISGENTNSSTHKLSWVDRLNQAENVELPEELRGFISATDQHEKLLSFLRARDLPAALQHIRNLFSLLSTADLAAARGAGDESKWSRELQDTMGNMLQGLPSDRKATLGTEVHDAIQGTHDGFEHQLGVAFKLKSFCREHGTSCIPILQEHLTIAFLETVTTQGKDFKRAKTELQNLKLKEKAVASGVRSLAKGVRRHMLRDVWGVQEDEEEVKLDSSSDAEDL